MEELMDQIFATMGQVARYQECARTMLIFAYGLALVRISGRRIFGKWSALDVIVSIVVGSNLSRALTGTAPLWGTLGATTPLFALHGLLAHLVSRSTFLSNLVEGSAVTLARCGTVSTALLHRYLVSQTDLHEALRQSGVNDLSDTRAVTLEPSGKIAVLNR
jgi:uncharacterized membrane protein YcaP (DUF421 family)